MDEDKMYIQDEQEDSRREEEEKDTGISPSVLDVRDHYDSPDAPEETEDKEPGADEGDEEDKDRESQEGQDQEEEPAEEEAPEEHEEEEHPKDDEDEMFQDRRARNVYTEEELESIDEEEPEEEPEILFDEEKEKKKKELLEARKRRAEKFKEYNRLHGQGTQAAQGAPFDAAGIENVKTDSGDDFYQERIRRAYGAHGDAGGDAGETAEHTGGGEELQIEEGDTYVGPAGIRHRGTSTRPVQGARTGGGTGSPQAPSVTGAEGISADTKSSSGDSFYEEHIRRSYGIDSGAGDASMSTEEAGSASVPVVEAEDASFVPRAGMASKSAGTRYVNSAPAKRANDAAGTGSDAWDITTSRANGISAAQDGRSSNRPAGTGYGHGYGGTGYGYGGAGRYTAGTGADAEPFGPGPAGQKGSGHTAVGRNAGIYGTKKKNVPAGSLKSITMDEEPAEGLAKNTPAARAESVSGEVGRKSKVVLEGKGRSAHAPEDAGGTEPGPLSSGKVMRLQPERRPGTVSPGSHTSARGRGSVIKPGERPGTIRTAGVDAGERPGTIRTAGVDAGERPGTIRTAGVDARESAGKDTPAVTGKSMSVAGKAAPGTIQAARNKAAGIPAERKGIITGAHVTGLIKDGESAAAAAAEKITEGAVKTTGISAGYIAPTAASTAKAAGKGITYAAGAASAISLGAGIIPAEDSKKKKEEKEGAGADKGFDAVSKAAKTAKETGSGSGGFIVKHRSVDERLGGVKKAGSKEAATDAAGRQEGKGLIRVAGIADTKKDSKIIAGNPLDREDAKGPVSRSMEEGRKTAGLFRRMHAAQAAQAGPMGGMSSAASAGGGAKLKIVAQAIAKKAVAGLLSVSITAGAMAGGIGMASRRTAQTNDSDWNPVQAHVMTTDPVALGRTEEDDASAGSTGTGNTGSELTQETSGTGSSTTETPTDGGEAENSRADAAGTGSTSGIEGSTDSAAAAGTGTDSTAAAAGTSAQDDGIPLTQDALEKMFTRMQAYGVLSPSVNYSSTTVTGGGAAQNPNAQSIVDYALSWVGKIPYKSSVTHNDPNNERFKPLAVGRGSDCSWFVYHVLMDCGVLPEGTDFIHSYEWGTNPEKYPGGVHIGTDLSKAQPGDILCTGKYPRKSSNSHVAIYIGNGERVECASGKGGVVRSKVHTDSLIQIVRFPGASAASQAGTQSQNSQGLVDYAKSWIGKITYGYGCNDDLHAGGKSDCSWFVYHCLIDTGVLPKGTKFIHSYEWGENASKYPGGTHIGKDLSQAQPGDIICMKSLPHVGIYCGNGEYVECSGHSNAVKIGKPDKSKISNIVRFSNVGTASTPSTGGTLTQPTTTRYGFTEGTEAIVEAHMCDFDCNNYDSFMRECGGPINYFRSLGGVFAKYCGVDVDVQTAGQFQEVAEYVFGVMSIYGPDYSGGGGQHKWNGNHGKGDQYGRFYKGRSVAHGFSIRPLESAYFKKKKIMTDCGSGMTYLMEKTGLFDSANYGGTTYKSTAWRKVDTSRGGTVITRKEDLQVGDLIQMSKTKSESGWKHVCVIGEIYPDGTIITYDSGNRYVNSGNFKKVWNPDSDGDFSGDYRGYHSWFGMRMRALDQSDAQTFGYNIIGPATRNLKEIRINSVKVDGKTKNRNKFSYNTLGEYSKHGKVVSAVNVNFTFVDKNRNDIAGTVLANGSQNDAVKAKKKADKVIKAAEKHKYVSYSPGGNDWKKGMDATNYVYKVLKEAGLYSGKERTVSGWRLVGKKVGKLENAQKGDIIVYKDHVAIYDGNGKIYECSAKTGGAAHSRKAEEPGKIISIRRLTDDISGSSAKAVNTTAGASGGTTSNPGGGFTINIPSGLGATHTYMGWQCITAPSSNQYKLRSEAGMNFDSEGFGVIKGRYVVACTTTYGNVGDCVDFYKKNGQVIHAVIGDIKSRGDAGCTKWGHHNGRNVIEFVVNKDTWYSNGAGSHVNPGNPSCHPEWASETVKAVNTGSWKNNAEVEHPTSMASPSDQSYVAGQGRSNEEPLYLAMQILSMTPVGANSCKNPMNMEQYDRYCFDILDWAITESYGADVRYTSTGNFYQCDITVDICCDPVKLQKNDSNFKWWDYRHENGDPQVKSYMDLGREIYCDVFNVDVYRLLAANASPFSGNEEIVYEFFRSKGLGPAQIAGIMGNIKGESNFNPNAVNASSGASGLFQWLGGRLDALKRMAESRGRDWTDIQTQLDYAWEEIQGSGWNGNDEQKEKFMSTTDAREAAMIFCTYFERTGNPADATRRAGYAESYYSTIMSAINPQAPTGYSSGGGGTGYVQWAVDIAKDDSHGYSMPRRGGNPDYDCSSLVFFALKANGYNVGNQAFTTHNMDDVLRKAGFTRVQIHSQSDMQPGDILWSDEHTEIYIGDGKNVGAHWDYDGKPGDSSGREINIGGCGSWSVAYRTSNPGTGNTGTGSGGDVVSLLQKWKKEGGGHSQVVENYNKFASKYNVSKMDRGDQWCSETASAAYAALGLADSIGGMSSNGGSYEKKAKKIGAWVSDRNYKPKRNDIIITGGERSVDRHTAVVISCDGNKIRCIAGGGSSIHYQTKRVGSDEIQGYVVPKGGAASSNAGGYGQGNTYYQPQRGWYRPTKGTWVPPVVPSAVTPSEAPPSSGEPTDNDWGVFIGREFHDDISKLRGKRQVVIEGQDQSKKEIATIKSSGAKVYCYLSIGSLEDYRPYYKKFDKDKFKLGDYEHWKHEKYVNVAQKEWRDYVVDHIAEELREKGIDSLWLDNTGVYDDENFPSEKIYQGLLDIVTRLKAKGFTLMYNGGENFVSRLIKEGKTNLVDGVMQEEVYSLIEDYDNDIFKKQDSRETRRYEAYLDRCKAAGIPVSCLEYTRDKSLIEKIKKKCKERGYEYYISGRVNLD